MRVGEYDRRVVLERVEDAVAVVRVDVHVRDARKAVVALQALDHDADVVEDAEARGVRAPRVVQAGDGHESALHAARHDRIAGDERGADDVAGRLEHALERRRVAGVEQAFPRRRARDDEIHVGGILEQLELGARRGPRRELQDAPVEALRDELAPEHVVAVRSEGVAVREIRSGRSARRRRRRLKVRRFQPRDAAAVVRGRAEPSMAGGRGPHR